MSDNSLIESNDTFWKWLSSRVTVEQFLEMFRLHRELEDYFIPKYGFVLSILFEIARTSYLRVKKIILRDNNFQKKYSNCEKQYIQNLLAYMEEYISNNLPVTRKDNQNKSIINDSDNSEPKISKQKKDDEVDTNEVIAIFKEKKDIPIYEIFDVELQDVDHDLIENISEFVQCWAVLARNNIFDINTLIQLTPKEISHLKGLGPKRTNMLYQILDSYLRNKPARLFPNIKINHQSFFPIHLMDGTIYNNIEDLFGEELLSKIKDNTQYWMLVFNQINNDSKVIYSQQLERFNIRKYIAQIPEERLKLKVSGFLEIFPGLISQKNIYNNLTISEFIEKKLYDETTNYSKLHKFVSFCNFDLEEEIRNFENDLGINDRWNEILDKRSVGKTLEETGNEIDVKRQRIQQIDNELFNRFLSWNNKHILLEKIYALTEQDPIITEDDIHYYFGDKSLRLFYFLKKLKESNFRYNKKIKAFVYKNMDYSNAVENELENLPDFFHEKQLQEIINLIQQETGANDKLIKLYIYSFYQKTGDVYHKNKLTKKLIYNFILRKYYPNGMAIYDDEELNIFRSHINNEFGNIDVPEKNRSISGRLANIGILCGRGIYMPKKDIYIPEILSQNIFNYIIKSDHDVFLMNTLFAVFEEELRHYGVNNKYYLQGILHELFGDKLFFSRDYVSKNEKITNIYNNIISFIKSSKIPVSTEQIQQVFPGITPIVISFATNHPAIINYFGEYLHRDNLPLQEMDEDFFRDLLQTELNDSKEHHSKDIFAIAEKRRIDILNRLGIFSSYSFFSVLECLFGEEFQFERPYIANIGVEIGRAAERLQELIDDSDEILIDEIKEFASNNHLQIINILEFIESQFITHILKDKNTLVKINNIEISEKIAKTIEEVISNNIDTTILIRNLTCSSSFPKIKIRWNEWLIYSIIKKWGTKLDVAITSPKYKDAIPVVAPKNTLSLETIRTDDIEDDNYFFSSVDTEDIDEYLQSYIHTYLEDGENDEF